MVDRSPCYGGVFSPGNKASELLIQKIEPLALDTAHAHDPNAKAQQQKSSSDTSSGSAVGLKNMNPFPSPDHLYHLGMCTTMDLKAIFGNTKCIILMGSSERATAYANAWASLTSGVPALLGKTERYSLYKVGSVIFVSHGMGMPSLSILLHELAKLLHYAECPRIPMIRTGTSGGIGVPPGSIVLTTNSFNGELEELYKLPILGKVVSKPSSGWDATLTDQLFSCRTPTINVVKGKTMSCDCFYEGQGRLDGAICPYTEQQKLAFLKQCQTVGVCNIEMEANLLGAFGKQVGLPVACACATLVNRLEGDQVKSSSEKLHQWTESVGHLVMAYLQKYIGTK